MVGDLLPIGVGEGPNVLSEGRLAGDGLDGQYGGNHQAGPGQHEPSHVDHAEYCTSPMLIAPARSLRCLVQLLSDVIVGSNYVCPSPSVSRFPWQN